MNRNRAHLARTVARGLLGAAVVGSASCATVAEHVLGTAAAELNDNPDRPAVDGIPSAGDRTPDRPGSTSGGEVTSVYVDGPTPGWERGPGPSPSAADSPYFTARLFGGGCPTLNISTGDDDDPFGPIDRPEPEPFTLDNNQNVDEHYVPFGHVRLGGPGTVGYQWEPLGLYGMAGGGCGFPGLALLSFGRNHGDEAVIHR